MGSSNRNVVGAVRLVPEKDIVEPMGIVIAGLNRTEVVPRVLAYVWGPVPETVMDDVAEPRAA